MKTCPQCSGKIEDMELVCGSCGYRLSTPAPAVTDSIQHGGLPDSGAPGAGPTVPKAPKPGALTHAQWAWIAIALLLVGAIAAAVLTGWQTAAQDSSAAAQPSGVADNGGGQAGPPTSRSEAAEPSASKWRGNRQPGWASDGSRTVSFLLESDNAVPVWMKSVRPVLTVRCLGGATEVFVVTNWAASIESTAEAHTVHLSFDDGPTVAEQWLDSADVQALFAPDGVSMARQIATSRSMHFAFTPFNAAPATVQFTVAGFDELIGSVAKTCRWRS